MSAGSAPPQQTQWPPGSCSEPQRSERVSRTANSEIETQFEFEEFKALYPRMVGKEESPPRFSVLSLQSLGAMGTRLGTKHVLPGQTHPALEHTHSAHTRMMPTW